MSQPRVDDTGHGRLARNLASSWAAQVVLLAVGFIMPRVIDYHVGQRMLGIWDFAWSLVNYLSLTGLGVGSAVNRYVARFRATKEWDFLNRCIASVICIQLCVATVILAATGLLVYLLPKLFSDRLGSDTSMAVWVVGLLGSSLAVTMLFDPARGVITGCHRWDIHNGLNVGTRLFASLGMIGALVAGYGLVGMSVSYFCATAAAEVARFAIARRICSELTLDLRKAQWRNVRELVRFGLKSVIVALPRVLIVQTTSVLLMNAAGPAAVAVLSRPLHLAGHLTIFVDKFAFLLTPTIGAIQGLGRDSELRNLMLQSTRFTVAIAMPLTLILVINGDWVVQLWMGNRYVNHPAIAMLAGGLFLATAQSPVLSVLTGMNMHGRIGLAALAVTAVTMVVGYSLASAVGWSIFMAAAIIGAGLSVGHGIALPWLACRKLQVPYLEYLTFAFLKPTLVCAVFSIVLLAGRTGPTEHELMSVVVSTVAGGAVVAAAYWRYLVPSSVRARIRTRIWPATTGET